MLVILSEAKDLASFPRGLPLTKDTRSFPSSLALLEGRPFVAGAPRGQALRRWRSSRAGPSSLALLEGRPFVAGAPRGQALRRWRSSRAGPSSLALLEGRRFAQDDTESYRILSANPCATIIDQEGQGSLATVERLRSRGAEITYRPGQPRFDGELHHPRQRGESDAALRTLRSVSVSAWGAVAEPIARAWPQTRGTVAWVRELTALQRQTTAADALRETAP